MLQIDRPLLARMDRSTSTRACSRKRFVPPPTRPALANSLRGQKRNAAAKAMMHAVMSDDLIEKPHIGISCCWFEGNPCNEHIRELGDVVKRGCATAGLNGLMHATVGVSDGITQGNAGMRFSLVRTPTRLFEKTS